MIDFETTEQEREQIRKVNRGELPLELLDVILKSSQERSRRKIK